MDARAQAAREHHHAARHEERLAAQHREQRDALVRDLYATGDWSYKQLATAVGCTPELIAKIIRPQRLNRQP